MVSNLNLGDGDGDGDVGGGGEQEHRGAGVGEATEVDVALIGLVVCTQVPSRCTSPPVSGFGFRVLGLGLQVPLVSGVGCRV